jgi:hypothetical protein
VRKPSDHKTRTPGVAKFRKPRGWTKVWATSTGTLYSFPLPQAIQDQMIATARKPAILSTGAVFHGHEARQNGKKQ